MAQLTTRWSSTQTRSQFAAIAWLRWRIMVNSFRRKGGAGELVGRILLYLTFSGFIVGLVAGAGVAGFFLAQKGMLSSIAIVLWIIFGLCQLLNIQLGQPGTTFDPTQLIRFPVSSRSYILIRLFFGLLTPANIVGTLMSFAVAVGISIALPALTLYAFLALAIFAATNVLFSRMVFAWVDRWLSTRRAREVFTGLIFAFSLGIQWANFTFNPAYNHHHTHSVSPQRVQFIQSIYHHAQPILAALPPELTTSALLAATRTARTTYLGYALACALFAITFLIIFALRMRTEYRGENLSDNANGVARTKLTPTTPRTSIPRPSTATATPARTFGLPPAVLPLLTKEFLYVRRTMGILYGLIMPIFLVLVFASKFASRSNALWIFPAAVAYTLLAVGPLSYNSFGLEGAGAQFYFMSPTPIRDVMLAKNIFNFAAGFIEILAIFGIITYVAGMPSINIALGAILWAIGTLAFNTVLGNRRSITSPKKINPQRMANKQSSPLSAFISLGILMASSAIAVAFFAATYWFHVQYMLIPIFAVFAAAGLYTYIQSLNTVDAFAYNHRETLLAELSKQS